jgi:hypothetical protein
MDFGYCKDCDKYRFLQDGKTCPSCIEEKEEWVVLRVGNVYGRMELYESGLTKREAEEMADRSGYLLAKKRSDLTKDNVIGYS